MLKFVVSKLTFLISDIISLGSLDEVVFMLQVNLNDRGLISPLSLTALLKIEKKVEKKVFNFLSLLSNLNILNIVSDMFNYFLIPFVWKLHFYLISMDVTLVFNFYKSTCTYKIIIFIFKRFHKLNLTNTILTTNNLNQ